MPKRLALVSPFLVYIPLPSWSVGPSPRGRGTGWPGSRESEGMRTSRADVVGLGLGGWGESASWGLFGFVPKGHITRLTLLSLYTDYSLSSSLSPCIQFRSPAFSTEVPLSSLLSFATWMRCLFLLHRRSSHFCPPSCPLKDGNACDESNDDRGRDLYVEKGRRGIILRRRCPSRDRTCIIPIAHLCMQQRVIVGNR